MKGNSKANATQKELNLEQIIQMLEPKQEEKFFGGSWLKPPTLQASQYQKITTKLKSVNYLLLHNEKTIKQQSQQILHHQTNITNLKQLLRQKFGECQQYQRMFKQLNKIYENKSLSVQTGKEDPQGIKAIVSFYNSYRQVINGKFKALGYTNDTNDAGFWGELSAVTQKYLNNNINMEPNHVEPVQKYGYIDQKGKTVDCPAGSKQQDKTTQSNKSYDQMLKEKQQQINEQLQMIRCIQEQLELSNNSELTDMLCKIKQMKNDLTKKYEEFNDYHSSSQKNQDSQQEDAIITENKSENKEEQFKQIISQIMKLDLQIHQHRRPLLDSQVGVKAIKEIFDEITTSVERMHQQLLNLRVHNHQQREKQRASIGQQRAGNMKTKQQLEEKFANLYQQCSKLSSDNIFLRQKIQQLEAITSKLSSIKQEQSESIETLNSQKEDYQGTIRQLRATLGILKRESQQTIEQLTTKISEANSHADKLKGQNRELSLLAQQVRDKLSASERNNQGLKAELNDRKVKESESNKKIGQLQLECQEMNKKDEQNGVQISNLTLALNEKLRKEKGQIERIVSQKQEQLREIEESIGKESVMVKEHDERERRQGKEQEKVEGYGKVLEELEGKIKVCEETLTSLKEQIQLHTSKLSQVKQELSGLESKKQEITKATQAREDLDRQYNLRMDQLTDLQHTIDAMKNSDLTQKDQSLQVKQVIIDQPRVNQPTKSESINPEIRSKEKELSKNFRIHKLYQVTLKNTQDKIQLSVVVQDDKANIYSSFNGKINLSQELKEIIHSKILHSYSKNAIGQNNYQITHTELLYLFPEKKELKFHQQVDEKPNIVVIVKLKNTDSVIVVYSEPMLSHNSQGIVNHLGGFLAVFKEEQPSENYKFFPLNKKIDQARPLLYHPYILIIGNSELKIWIDNSKVKSNIPTKFQYFETPGETSPAFMFGSQARETEVQRYEIYQVIMGPIEK